MSAETATEKRKVTKYTINPYQLLWFSKIVNAGDISINGELMDHIVLNENVLTASGGINRNNSDYINWTPIYNYMGEFDGNKKTISGLYFEDTSVSCVGLFGSIYDGGVVKNVGVTDSYLSAEDYVGGVAGVNSGTILSCYNDGTVRSKGYGVGGITGDNSDGVVSNCYNTGDVYGIYVLGGVVGYNNFGLVEDCYNAGSVSGYDVGGISSTSGTVTNCYYRSDIVTNSNDYGMGKNAQAFSNGEVCYLLGEQFGQLLGIETAPVLGGNTVYRNQIGGCTTGTYTYAYENEERTLITHNWSDATCTTPKTCATCGTTDGNVLQHSFGENTVHKPAPGVMGYSEHTCTACGHTEQFDFVELQGFTVSGLINSFLLDGEIKIELLVDREVQYSIVVVGSNVRYDIEDVVSETYTLRISKGNHVTREYEVVVGQEDVRIDAIICPIGEVTGDGLVNIKDFQRMLRHVNKTSILTDYALSCGDLTDEGSCNIKDFQRLLRHVNKTNPLF